MKKYLFIALAAFGFAACAEKIDDTQNPSLNGASYDYYTDPEHVLYGDKVLENISDQDSFDEYGTTYYLAKRTRNWFEIIRELD